MWCNADRFLDARNSGSVNWYLSANIVRGRVRWACKEHDRSLVGVELESISSSSVGWRPVGSMNVAENSDGNGWWRAGKENSVGLGFVSSPTIVRKPPKDSSSGSLGDSTDKIPTSTRSFALIPSISTLWTRGAQNAVIVRAWEIVSKSKSTVDASRKLDTRVRQSIWELAQSLFLAYSTRSPRLSNGW